MTHIDLDRRRIGQATCETGIGTDRWPDAAPAARPVDREALQRTVGSVRSQMYRSARTAGDGCITARTRWPPVRPTDRPHRPEEPPC